VAEGPSELEVLRRVGERLNARDGDRAQRWEASLSVVEESWPHVTATIEPASDVLPDQHRIVLGFQTSYALTSGKRDRLYLTVESPQWRPSDDFGIALASLLSLAKALERSQAASGMLRDGLVGSSSGMIEALRLAERLALERQPVLLVGEAGCGKERLARFLHRNSPFSSGPFVVFNGAALPEAMVDVELFGHPHGRGGRFEEAASGTLVIKDVGVVPEAARQRLFSLLRETAPVRLILTSREPLEILVAAGRMRKGRIAPGNVIQVPPLRDRGSDIVTLADHFVTISSLQTGKEVKRISTPALEMLLTYPWPGNVRELAAVVERAVLATDDEVIHGFHLPPSLQSSVYSGTTMHGRLDDRLDSLEYEMLVEALKSTRGNVTLAARELGLTKRVMGLRLKKYELDYRPFRQGPEEWGDDDDPF